MIEVHFTKIALDSLDEINTFLKYKWRQKQIDNFRNDIETFIQSLELCIVNYPHYKLVCGQRISKEKGRRFNDQSNRKAPTLLRKSYLPIAFAAALIFSTRSPQSIP